MRTYEWWYIKKFGELALKAQEIVSVMRDSAGMPISARALAAKDLEDAGDRIVKEVVCMLRSADKPIYHSSEGTILAAAHDADGPADEAERAANRMAIYKVELDETSAELLKCLDQALASMQAAAKALGKERRKKTDYALAAEHCEKIKCIESEADIVYRAGLKKIFQEQDCVLNSPRELTRTSARALFHSLRQKEVLEILEHALDKCQSFADKLEGISHDLQ